MSASGKLVVAAIDIGTTHSGLAFSSVFEYERDPSKIYMISWIKEFGAPLLTTSCILFNKKKLFHSFGYDAENKYSELTLDEQHQEWYFFKNFKMSLCNKKAQLSRAPMINTVDGKEMVALDVFLAAIKFLSGHLLNTIERQMMEVTKTDIQWVLTIPAFWDDVAKQIMREAAEKAGIGGNGLIIVPEPEAASVYCMHHEMQHNNRAFDSGAKYMIIIAEDETVEMTVYEVQLNGILKELYKAEGGDWGGNKVDESFLGLLADIVGNDVMEAFRSDFSDSFDDLMRDFDNTKETLRADKRSHIAFRLQSALFDTFNNINPEGDINRTIKSKPKYKNQITLSMGKLRVGAHIAKALFEESCNKIIYHMQELFRYPNLTNVSFILLVGGYGGSNMLQDAIGNAFRDKRLIVPYDAKYAVLKGAVLYGHRHKNKCESNMNS